MTPEALRAELEAAAAGLRYVSEADHPFAFVSLPGAAPDAASVAAAAGRAGATAEEVPLERFFAGQVEDADPGDPASAALVPRFRALRDLLRARLPDARAVRVGGPPEWECFLVGSVDGGVAGLRTVALET